jgi:hypothetical protein
MQPPGPPPRCDSNQEADSKPGAIHYANPFLREELRHLGVSIGQRYTLQKMLDNYAQLRSNAVG